MSVATESTALATREEQSTELAITAQQAMARHEIEGAIVVAQRFPRNEDAAYGRVMQSCERWTFASMARYSYPRGGQQIEGPSVSLAREVARCWGNIRYGADIVHDDESTRTVRGWAWDVQTNTKETQDSTFRKLIYRKRGGWQSPDERDLRELTNKHGAVCSRNCLLHLVPPDLIDEALRASKATLERDASKDPAEARRKMIRAFQTVGVTVDDMEEHLGHPLKQATPAEITDLRAIWKSISDGNSTWAEYAKPAEPEKKPADTAGATMEDLAKQPEAPQADDGATLDEYREVIAKATSKVDLDTLEKHAADNRQLGEAARKQIIEVICARRGALAKAAKKKPPKDKLFDTAPSAQDA